MIALSLPALVVFTLALRLVGHARYLHDYESLMVPTTGRELGHGHWGDWDFYVYNLYQGGILVDGGLSALGFAVFGDHELAWKWYALAYAVGIAAAGMAILERTAGAAAAIAFPLLLAASPFLLKDGLVTPAGHHSSAVFFALLTVAVAVRWKPRGGGSEATPGVPPTRGPGVGHGLAAGLVLGVGVWYSRTTVAVLPAVVVALAPGGWRALLGLGLGCLCLPGIGGVESWLITRDGAALAEQGFGQTFGQLMWDIRSKPEAPEVAAKLGEALSVAVHPLLFAQPTAGASAVSPTHPVFASAGAIWSAAWAVTLPLLLAIAGGAAARRRSGPADGAASTAVAWGTALVLLIPAGYVATYVASPFRVDPALAEVLRSGGAPPGISAPRYLLPGFLGLTLGLAHVVGLLWRRRSARPLAVLLLATVALPGAVAAGIDWGRDRDRPSELGELRPFHYHKLFGPGRGPSAEVHLACREGDSLSRANHLRTAGWLRLRSPWELAERPTLVAELLEETRVEASLSAAELGFVAHGMGLGLGDVTHSDAEVELGDLVVLARAVASELGPESSAAFLSGFTASVPMSRVRALDDPTVATFCGPDSPSDQPLCVLLGHRFADAELEAVPRFPEGLFTVLLGGRLEEPIGEALVRGAGRAARSTPGSRPPTRRGPGGPPPSPPPSRRAGGRSRCWQGRARGGGSGIPGRRSWCPELRLLRPRGHSASPTGPPSNTAVNDPLSPAPAATGAAPWRVGPTSAPMGTGEPPRTLRPRTARSTRRRATPRGC